MPRREAAWGRRAGGKRVAALAARLEPETNEDAKVEDEKAEKNADDTPK